MSSKTTNLQLNILDHTDLIDIVPFSENFTKLDTIINAKANISYVNDRVKIPVPANAKFTDTDTKTFINNKTGVITKEDIVALGIPAQDTNTTYTKSSLGLGNVDNLKQMPITGGTFTGEIKASNNTDNSAQMRNITISDSDPVASQMNDGEIWIKYV